MASPKSALILLAAAVVASTTAWSQQSPMPADIAAKLQEIGRVVDPPATAPLYAPLQEKEPYQGVKIERDVKYGPEDRNLLDIFTPEARAADLEHLAAGADQAQQRQDDGDDADQGPDQRPQIRALQPVPDVEDGLDHGVFRASVRP